jgi:CheY-like chemotaxis protein
VVATAGYTALAVSNGADALSLLRVLPTPCLVLTDLKMPVMDGWELVQRITGSPTLARHPVIVFSGAETRAMRPPVVVRFLPKPVLPDQVLAAVRDFCGEGGAPTLA